MEREVVSQHVSTMSLEEGGLKPKAELPNSERLHEMAANLYELYSHHSPVKMALSRSHELGFEYSPHNPSTPVSRSTSIVAYDMPTTSLTAEQKKLNFQQVPHSKSMGSSVDGVHYFGNMKKFPQVQPNNRYIAAPYAD